MTSAGDTYVRAVELFGSLTQAPVATLCRKPADLVRATGRAPSTAFRLVAEAETVGLVAREIDQTYRLGALARRVGFTALGFGELSDVSGPLLRDLRETLRRTAFIAFLRGQEVRVGLWSLGRGIDYVRPEPSYLLDAPFIPQPGECAALHLKTRAFGGERLMARAIALGQRNDCHCLVGALIPRSDPTIGTAVDPALKRLAALVPVQGKGAA
jgi:hypothetical protein